MTPPVVYGAPYSVYVRIVRMTLEEKSVDYVLHEVDIFASDASPDTDAQRHPFHRIPTFDHDGFALYETAAITRYVDEVFPSPSLTPDSIEARARMNQIISILDNYAYRSWVWGLYVQLVNNPEDNLPTDQAIVDNAVVVAQKCLDAISDLHDGDGSYLVGQEFTLADIYAIPMYVYLTMTDIGRTMVDCPEWSQWWKTVQSRDSVTRTRYPREAQTP